MNSTNSSPKMSKKDSYLLKLLRSKIRPGSIKEQASLKYDTSQKFNFKKKDSTVT